LPRSVIAKKNYVIVYFFPNNQNINHINLKITSGVKNLAMADLCAGVNFGNSVNVTYLKSLEFFGSSPYAPPY
jgi:hypothetical protein